MPPKKKDKGKALLWLQCTICGKLVSPPDAEAHSKSCETDHGYILKKTFHGKVIKAEEQMNQDGTSITKTIRDKGSVVWLSIPTMQVCGLSIGQYCLLNDTLVKRTWPLKSLPLSHIAVCAQTLMELQLKEGEKVSVKRFHPQDNIALDVVLRLNEPNNLFQTTEFSAFAASFLDHNYITQETPLSIRYFGHVCHCWVNSLSFDRPNKVHESSNFKTSISPLSNASTHSTPAKSERIHNCSHQHESDSHIIDQNVLADLGDGDASHCLSSQDLSASFVTLNISESSLGELTSTPKALSRQATPNLVTPVKSPAAETDLELSLSELFAKVSSKVTKFSVIAKESPQLQGKQSITLMDVGGMASQIDELKSRISRAQQPSCSNRCILVHGPVGTGKTLLIKALTAELGLHIVSVTGTDIWSKLFGEAESNLRQIFRAAQARAPSIIVIDDIDVVCPRRLQSQAGQQEHRIVGTLLTLIDELSLVKNSAQAVVVIGITNNKDGIDPALRRSGRFGCEVEIGVPTSVQRKQILEVMLSKVPHEITEEEIDTVARNAHGYVGADLAALVNEASMHSLNCLPSSSSSKLSMADFAYAGLHVKPSALREIQLEVPHVRWTDIGGMSEVKMRLHEAVSLPLSHPEVFQKLGIEPPRGLLMYGPPGCSKTMVARALATECKLNFLAVKGPELFNQYVGESEKAIREVFRKARSAAPSIIFFDEIDAIAAKRGSSSGSSGVDDRVLTQLLTEMDGLEFLKDVFIVAATNRPDKIDRALLRPGRFDSLVYVPLPDEVTRAEILEKKLSKMMVAPNVTLEALVQSTQDYSGAEIIQVCQEAALFALREDIQAEEVGNRHFEAAIKKVQAQIDPELLKIYEKFSHSRVK